MKIMKQTNIKKIMVAALAVLFLLLHVYPLTAEVFEETIVFDSGTGGYTQYRIPAIVRAGNGDLLAFCEGRAIASDFCDIDVVMKRSTNNGVSWSSLQVVADNGSDLAGNPGVVVDAMDNEHPNRIWLAYNIASYDEGDIKSGAGVREIMVKYSDDDGYNWSSATNITNYVHRPNEPPDYNFTEDWRWYAITPGHCIQLQSGTYAGRLFFSANHSLSDQKWYSHCFWSDDHGATWVLGGTVGVNTNECMSVQLSNNDVMINMRNYDGTKRRAVAYSSNGGASWYGLFRDPELPEPICQASIIRYDSSTILFSNPPQTSDRNHITVKVSYDDGDSWSVSREVYSGSSAYSDLVIQDDQRIGLLYERDDYGYIYYAHFDMDWLTGSSSGIIDESWDSTSGWSTSGSASIDPAGQLKLVSSYSNLSQVYRTDKNIPANYTIEFRAKVDDYGSGDATLGIKVQDGSYRLMFKRQNDGFYAIDSSGSWQKKKDLSASLDWHTYKIEVANGSVTNVYIDGNNQIISWDLRSISGERVEHWTMTDSSEIHFDWTKIYEPSPPIIDESWDSTSGWSTSGSASIDPAGQLKLVSSYNNMGQVYRTDKNIPANYTIEFRAKVDDYGSGDATLGIKVQDGSYRLMFKRQNDGFYAIDSSGSWQKKKDLSASLDWHTYKIVVDSGSVTNVYIDGVNQNISWNLRSRSGERVEHWTKTDSSEIHFDWTRIY